MLKVGDIVEVRFIRELQADKWVSAKVLVITPGALYVEAMHGAFDKDGHNRMVVALSGKGRAWR